MADQITLPPVDAPEAAAATRARLAWEAERIQEALASVRAEGTISHSEIRAWVESWDTPEELPQPQPRFTAGAAGRDRTPAG